MNKWLIPALLLPTLILLGCEDNQTLEQDTYTYTPLADIPTLRLDSLSTTQVTAYQDSLVFSVFYQDGNGDIGSADPDRHSLELRDNRDSNYLVFFYHLPPQAPAGADIALQGSLHIVLEHSILLDPNNSEEQTTFSLRLRDAADNWSNTVQSPMITIMGQ